jgi:hypothetical protein
LKFLGSKQMNALPDILQSGELARLIPVVAETSKENRAASILLAGMSAVDQLSQALLGGIGQRLGTRTHRLHLAAPMILWHGESWTERK